LARVNIANRPTLRAFEQAYAIAVSGGNAVAARELRATAIKRWDGSAAFRLSPLARARRRTDRLEGAVA
jgi:hypothetical protein